MTSNARRTRTKRKPSTSANRFQVRIFAEGKRTEVQYFNHLYRLHKDQVIVSVAPHLASIFRAVDVLV